MLHRRNHSMIALQLALCALLTTTVFIGEGCAGRLAAPVQLSPVGAAAFHANRAIRGISVLQDVAIQGEQSKVISTNDARTIIKATEIAGQAGIQLADALKAGLPALDARTRAILAIRAALNSVPQQLSPQARDTIGPYVQIVLTALSALEP